MKATIFPGKLNQKPLINFRTLILLSIQLHSHMDYDFHQLDDKDFELLARDLLNAQFSLDVQSFKTGKDKGVDLRFSTSENNNELIVQVKHYLKSGIKKLKYDLEVLELPKVKALHPKRYMLVTSVPLSATDKDDIQQIFTPYIQTPNDIFGSEDLNKYLASYEQIETKWYKLWLTSVPVMSRILHHAVNGRSLFVENKIRGTVQRYVYCKSYDDAFDILKQHKYILITGQPGVGKTTLAKLLSFKLLSEEYQLIYIDSDVTDAEKMLSADPGVKQFVFFDDFLGANYFEITNPKTTESAFVNFLERIKETENKYLILTTRTTVYHNARDRYEKMRRIKIDLARKEISLGQYSFLEKARIFYKHIYFSDLPDRYKQEIIEDRNYWKIIEHDNFNPRLIEFITTKTNLPVAGDASYMAFAVFQLNHPEEVWRHLYQQQFSLEERILWHVVYAQKSGTRIEDTRLMFDYMLRHEVKEYLHKPVANPFEGSLRKLLDGILTREVSVYQSMDSVQFINPSVKDFLTYYFRTNPEERWN